MNWDFPLLLQYGIVGGLLFLAILFLVNLIRKNFSRKKFSTKKEDCGPDCGCQK